MGVANFFDKSALAASQVLKGFDREVFAAALTGLRPAVAIGDAVPRSFEGRIAAEMTVNLIARLYPSIILAGSTELLSNLRALAQRINPEIEIGSDLREATGTLVLGSAVQAPRGPAIQIGSHGWTALVSQTAPQAFGPSNNPFGAAVAACLGAANLFRYAFRDHLPAAALDESAMLDLRSLEPSRIGVPDELPPLDIGESLLVGVGAVGNAAAWTLRQVRALSGRLVGVDAENVDLSNLQRYVMTEQSSVGVAKVKLLQRFFEGHDLQIVGHQLPWPRYLAQRGNFDLQRVLVAVDSAVDRCAIAASMPRKVFNAWTQAGDLGVSRHGPPSTSAPCLMCLYLPRIGRKNHDEVVAESLGLLAEIVPIRRMLATGALCDWAFLAKVGLSLGVPEVELRRFEGQPLSLLYSNGICGGAFLRFSGAGRATRENETPLAFQSALSGVLLASELIFDVLMNPTAFEFTTARLDILRPIPGTLAFREQQSRTGRCICEDELFRASYTRKFSG